MHERRPTYLIHSLPLPTAAGVVVPHRGMVLNMHPSAGNGYVGRLGFFDAIASIAGTLIGANRADKAEKRRLDAEKEMARQTLEYNRFIADREAAIADRQIDAALSTARIQAEGELASINAAYVTQLSAQRVQKQVAQDTLSAQLLAQTQGGIFALADRGYEEAGSVARAFPRAGATAAAVMVVATVAALAYTFTKRSGRGRRRGKGKGARNDAPSLSPTPTLTAGAAA